MVCGSEGGVKNVMTLRAPKEVVGSRQSTKIHVENSEKAKFTCADRSITLLNNNHHRRQFNRWI